MSLASRITTVPQPFVTESTALGAEFVSLSIPLGTTDGALDHIPKPMLISVGVTCVYALELNLHMIDTLTHWLLFPRLARMQARFVFNSIPAARTYNNDNRSDMDIGIFVSTDQHHVMCSICLTILVAFRRWGAHSTK